MPPPPPARPADRPLDMGAKPDDGSGRRVSNRSFFSPDGRLLGVASDGFITVWEVPAGRRVGQFPRPAGSLRHVAIAPDGQTIAMQTVGETTVWELTTGTKRLTLDSREVMPNGPVEVVLNVGGGHDFPRTVAYSPDGRLLAAAGEDRTIHVRSAWDGRELARFAGHRGGAVSFAYSPDGRRLVSAHTDTTALVWDVEPARRQLQPPTATIDAGAVEALFEALANPDAAKAFVAMRQLAGDPAAAVAALRRVKRAKPAGAGVIARLIGELNDPKFAVREKARQELERLGQQAAAPLRQAADAGPSAEVQRTAKRLLERLEQLKLTPEQLRAVRAVEVLERVGTPEAAAILKDLAAGAEEVAPTPQARAALKRLRQ